MNLPDLFNIDEYIRIPKIFYNSESNLPFSNCIICNKYLLQNGVTYIIEKAFRNYKGQKKKDIIFEYAMCIKCLDMFHESFSKESKRRIDEYFESRVDFVERRKNLINRDKIRLKDWISNCVIKRKNKKELDEYQVLCQCDGKDMLYTYAPFLISGEAMDEIAQLLSNETIDSIDKFYDIYNGFPPQFKKFFTRDKIKIT